jgi:hypothetical protein
LGNIKIGNNVPGAAAAGHIFSAPQKEPSHDQHALPKGGVRPLHRAMGGNDRRVLDRYRQNHPDHCKKWLHLVREPGRRLPGGRAAAPGTTLGALWLDDGDDRVQGAVVPGCRAPEGKTCPCKLSARCVLLANIGAAAGADRRQPQARRAWGLRGKRAGKVSARKVRAKCAEITLSPRLP